MGVKLNEIVVKKPVSFEELVNKTVAVDFSNSAYQFLSSVRQQDGTPLMDSEGRVTSHLMGAWMRFSNLIQQNIKMVIVFDGKMPELKHGTHASRVERKEIAKKRYDEARSEDDQEGMARYAKQFSHLTKEMVEESKELVRAMGLPYIQAPAESDAQMSWLCKKGDAWASASSDYDSLLHGSPRMLTNLTLSQKRRTSTGAIVKITPELIELDEVLKSLNITQEQLIVIAILCGTDYNPGGIKGIGPKKALKLVTKEKNYNKLFEELGAEFDWKEIMELFKKMNVEKNYKLSWSEPDADAIKEILVEGHNFSEDRVNSVLNRLMDSKKKREQAGLGAWM